MKLILGPEADIMILAGDILPGHDEQEFISNQLNPWLRSAPVGHIVLTWGNHDWLPFNGHVPEVHAHVLVEETIEIKGLKIYGSPWSLPFRQWAWMAPESTLEKIYSFIPDDVDIIVSHSAPQGVCDKASDGQLCGSLSLLHKMFELAKLKLIVCGHIHEARGEVGIVVNASFMANKEGMYIPRLNPWIEVEL
jgi:Icc-related predicted phosphoesterase